MSGLYRIGGRRATGISQPPFNAASTIGITSAGYEYQYQSSGPLTGSSATIRGLT
jgi:hypothetical protein